MHVRSGYFHIKAAALSRRFTFSFVVCAQLILMLDAFYCLFFFHWQISKLVLFYGAVLSKL